MTVDAPHDATHYTGTESYRAHEASSDRTTGTVHSIEHDLGSTHSDKLSPHVRDEVLGSLHSLSSHDKNFKQDLATITARLHHDGYLPDVSFVDLGDGNVSMWKKEPHASASGGHTHAPSESQAEQDTQALQAATSAPGNSGTTPGSDTGGTAYTGSSTSPSGVSISGGEVASANEIISMLMKDGLSRAGAAAIVGNMMQENSLSTKADAGGLGLCQWIGSRATQLEAYAKANGESATSLNAQVGFVMQELKTQYPSLLNELKTTTNAEQGAADFEQQYERAGIPDNGNREAYAESALKQSTSA